MKRKLLSLWLFVWLGAAATDAGAALGPPSGPPVTPPGFVLNAGQIERQARFYAVGANASVYFEPDAVVIDRIPDGATPGVSLRVGFPHARSPLGLEGQGARDSRVNAFIGSDPRRWQRAIPTYDEVRYRGIAPGADLVYRIEEGHLEYDVILAPRANLSAAVLRYHGADRLTLDGDGGLVIHTAGGRMREAPPRLYQDVDGVRRWVAGGFRIVGRRDIAFWASDYDHDRPLVVDPGMLWSTFVGGVGADCPVAVATNQAGETFIVGYTASADYPSTTGAYQTTKRGDNDVVVTKLGANGSMVWSTFLGGSRWDAGRGIAVDASGNVYVCGETLSEDFPVSAGAFRNTIGMSGTYDAFVAKLGPNGNVLSYSTYLGGTSDDYGNSIAINSSGLATVAGTTGSVDYPTTSGVVKPTRTPQLFDGSDGFVTRLNATGTGLVYSTYVGSNSGSDLIRRIVLDSGDRATVTGSTASPDFPTTASAFDRTFGGIKEAFVARLSATGSAYVFSTYLGGAAVDEGFGVAVDGSGNTYAIGATTSTDFPTTSGAFQPSWGGGTSVYDAYVVELSSTGAVVYSSFLGRSGSDAAYGVAATASGKACVTGVTTSTDLPVTSGAISGSYSGGSADGFAVVVASGGSRIDYSTYLGSSGNDQAWAVVLRPDSRVILSGYTDGANFPTSVGAFDRTHAGGGTFDGFVMVADVGLGTSTAVGDLLPSSVHLGSPTPNPFHSTVSFSIRLDQVGRVMARVIDGQGRVIKTLTDRELGPGSHMSTWTGGDERGRRAPPGVYLIQVVTREWSEVRRVVLLR